MPDIPSLAYSVSQAAERTNIPETKLWAAIKDRQLRSFKVGRSRRVTEDALREYVTTLEEKTLALGGDAA